MPAPRADCRRCPHYDPPSHELSRGWCCAHEQTVVRLVGRCDAYDGPTLDDEEQPKKES